MEDETGRRAEDGRIEDEKEEVVVVVVVVAAVVVVGGGTRKGCSCTRLFPRQSVTSPFDANNQPTREERRVVRGPTARPIADVSFDRVLPTPPSALVSFRSAVSRINSLDGKVAGGGFAVVVRGRAKTAKSFSRGHE